MSHLGRVQGEVLRVQSKYFHIILLHLQRWLGPWPQLTRPGASLMSWSPPPGYLAGPHSVPGSSLGLSYWRKRIPTLHIPT